MFFSLIYSGESGKEKLIPLLQGPSDTKDLHSSKWLNESRKPESLLAPDLVAFTVQVPQYMDYCHNSGEYKLTFILLVCPFFFFSFSKAFKIFKIRLKKNLDKHFVSIVLSAVMLFKNTNEVFLYHL